MLPIGLRKLAREPLFMEGGSTATEPPHNLINADQVISAILSAYPHRL